MVKRVRLLEDIAMPVEGQICVVAAGSVLDTPDTFPLSSKHISVLSPSEPARTLKNVAHTVPIRGVRIK